MTKGKHRRYFWHNIGRNPDDNWWGFLKVSGQICTGFKNQPGDKGEHILKSYVSGDAIIAYANRYGVIGWGVIENPNSYRLLDQGHADDRRQGKYLHRIEIRWKVVVDSLDYGIKPSELRTEYGLRHPRNTSEHLWGSSEDKAKQLIEELNRRFVR